MCQCQIQNVPFGTTGNHGFRQNHTEATWCLYIVHNDRPLGSIAYIHKATIVLRIINDQILKTWCRHNEIFQRNCFQHFARFRTDCHNFRWTFSYRCLQRIDNAHIECPNNFIFIDDNVNDRLQRLAIAFLLRCPTWERLQCGTARTFFECRLGQCGRYTGLISWQRNNHIVADDLCTRCNYIFANVFARTFVKWFRWCTWPFKWTARPFETRCYRFVQQWAHRTVVRWHCGQCHATASGNQYNVMEHLETGKIGEISWWWWWHCMLH